MILHELDTTFQRKGLTFPALRCLFTSYKFCQLADLVIANTSKKKMVASQLLRKSPVICWLNFSTIGEPEVNPPLLERQPNMIVFGSDRIRRRLYEKFTLELISACKALKIQRIYDVGRHCELPFSEFEQIPIIQMGIQPEEVISQLMLTSQAGFLDYSLSPGELGKSTIFAAYCSHGLVPVLTAYNPSEADGIERDKHYLVLNKNSHNNVDASQLQQISDNVYSWYQDHTLTKMSDFVGSYLLDGVVE